VYDCLNTTVAAIVGAPMCASFFLDGKSIEYLKSYIHLGHVIVHNLNDFDDIEYRRICLIGQISSILCFLAVLFKLLKRVCWNHNVIWLRAPDGS